MAKIKTIHINDFKFFGTSEEPIEIEGKHVLLYGENGSGKSSIYWALYTLLESANKTDADIKAYFTKGGIKDLVNLYAPNNSHSFVKIVLDNEPETNYQISHTNTSINANSDAKSSSNASDFITYRFLFNLHNFRQGEDINLFPLFLKDIMKYVTVSGIATQNLEVQYNELKKMRKGRAAYDTQKAAFTSHFDSFLTNINTKANEIIKELGYAITFSLKHNLSTFDDYKNSMPQLSFELINYYGQLGSQIPKPQSFLNEAKWSAIALAIRLAILELRLQDAELKVLVLDDLMLSLDMSNRDKVLNLIFEKYLSRYQVFIFTHDRVFFEHSKNYIEDTFGETPNEWGQHFKIFEMYVDDLNPTQEKPKILPYQTSIQKAWKYYNEKDYAVCGNSLRIALEEFFIKFIPKKYRKGEDDKINILNYLLVCAKEYFNIIGFDKSSLDILDRYKKRSLNPASHYNPNTNYFKSELQDVFGVYKELQKLKNEIIINKDNCLKFSIKTTCGKEYLYEVEIADDLRLYHNGSTTSVGFFLSSDTYQYTVRRCTLVENNIETILTTNNHKMNNKTLLQAYNETKDGITSKYSVNVIEETDMYQVFKDIDGNTLNSLKRY
jgi:energy-coupling factor transporter ATP-binding protein EcfA2